MKRETIFIAGIVFTLSLQACAGFLNQYKFTAERNLYAEETNDEWFNCSKWRTRFWIITDNLSINATTSCVKQNKHE